MSNVEVFDTTFAVTILVIMAVCIPTALLLANWFLHPGKIKDTAIMKGVHIYLITSAMSALLLKTSLAESSACSGLPLIKG